MKTLFVILGPTGVGKTELCLAIAKHLQTPIINADSRQIFAELPIGTCAPTPKQQSIVKHYFVGNHQLHDYYSAAKYEQDALSLLTRLFNGEEDGIEHDTALLSGGSMMYIDAVCKGIDEIPTVDDNTREFMKQRLASEGLKALVEELKRLDPEHWSIVDRNNPRRVVHALEICHMTGKTYTSFRTNSIKQRPFNIVKIGLNRSRDILYDRINQRVLTMMEQGLENEARKVYPLRHLNSLNTVGYKELFAYFDGLIPQEEAIRQIQSNTRQYMRKQLTWYKKDENVTWFEPDNIEDILKYIDNNRV
ncbi:MAG: tRNA (adenosine(37)-N6)-dimethylallyltransferase MiaA [Prevotella sp.]|nr:tRNA (adenosine(37)-N6)-dimethylallyltransferase MiaA [Prevotella sp.]